MVWRAMAGEAGARRASRFQGPRLQQGHLHRHGHEARFKLLPRAHPVVAYLPSNIATFVFGSFLLGARIESLVVAYLSHPLGTLNYRSTSAHFDFSRILAF
jgi:hypothetical protein